MTKDTEFSIDDIDYVSKLALLDLNDDEKKRLSKQLSSIFSYFKKLDNLDTTNIEPTRHPIEGLNNIFRKDKISIGLTNKEALKNSKHTKDGYFKAPKILKE